MKIIRILSGVISLLLTEIIVAQIIPIFKKRELSQNIVAEKSKRVFLDKFIYTMFITCFIIVYIIGIVLICFPNLCEVMGFNYTITLIVWWIPALFSSTIFVLLNKEVVYNENSFTVRNSFGLRKTYSYSEIISIEKTRNLIIKTKKGKILLFNSLYGIDVFYIFVQEKIKGSI